MNQEDKEMSSTASSNHLYTTPDSFGLLQILHLYFLEFGSKTGVLRACVWKSYLEMQMISSSGDAKNTHDGTVHRSVDPALLLRTVHRRLDFFFYNLFFLTVRTL